MISVRTRKNEFSGVVKTNFIERSTNRTVSPYPGGTGGGCGGDGQDGNIDIRLIRWEDTVANIILGTEPNAPLDYASVLELRHPIVSIIGGREGQLERIERNE